MRSSSFWFILLGLVVPAALFVFFVYFNMNVFLIILLLTYLLTVIITFMPKRAGSD